MHFQGWKHNYYFFTSRAALLAVPYRLDQATIISRYGLIPWHWKASSTKIDDDWKLIQKSIIHTDEETVSYTQAQKNLLPSRYCLRFSKDLKTCNVWLDSKQHIVIHQIPQEFRDLRQDDGISSTLLLLLPPRLIDPQHNRDLEIYFQTLHSEIVLCEGLKYLVSEE